MRMLLLGGSGRLGSELLAAADRRYLPHRATYYTHPRPGLTPLDVRDTDGVRELIADYEPAEVVWAAPPLPEAVADVAKVVGRTSATFTLISGDGVFGECKVSMREEDKLKPVGELAAAQAACEQAVRDALPERHLISRTGFVFGTRSKADPLTRLVRQLSMGETVLCDDETMRMPTFAQDLADAMLTLLGREATGTYHLIGPDRHTEFSFARTAAMVCRLDADLVQSRPSFERVGPKRAILDRFKAMSALGRTSFRNVGDGVRAIRDRSRVAVPVLKAA